MIFILILLVTIAVAFLIIKKMFSNIGNKSNELCKLLGDRKITKYEFTTKATIIKNDELRKTRNFFILLANLLILIINLLALIGISGLDWIGIDNFGDVLFLQFLVGGFVTLLILWSSFIISYEEKEADKLILMENYKDIFPGQTKKEVQDLMGYPDSTNFNKNSEIWVYQFNTLGKSFYHHTRSGKYESDSYAVHEPSKKYKVSVYFKDNCVVKVVTNNI